MEDGITFATPPSHITKSCSLIVGLPLVSHSDLFGTPQERLFYLYYYLPSVLIECCINTPCYTLGKQNGILFVVIAPQLGFGAR